MVADVGRGWVFPGNEVRRVHQTRGRLSMGGVDRMRGPQCHPQEVAPAQNRGFVCLIKLAKESVCLRGGLRQQLHVFALAPFLQICDCKVLACE